MQGDENKLAGLEKKLAYSFKNVDLLKEALTHPSNNLSYSNQRLEFFGDSIVPAVISERIYICIYIYITPICIIYMHIYIICIVFLSLYYLFDVII